MTIRHIAATAAFAMAIPVAAAAQDFGVMHSAETMNKGTFTLMVNPIAVFGKHGTDNEIGVALAGGYGFGDRFEMKAKASFFDGLGFLGAEAEYWLAKGKRVNVSVIGGFHRALVSRAAVATGQATLSGWPLNGGDAKGFDLTGLAGGRIANRLDLFAALDFSRTSCDNADVSFWTMHFVPGIQYRVSSRIDVVSEVGLALNDNSSHYVSVGLAFYTRAR